MADEVKKLNVKRLQWKGMTVSTINLLTNHLVLFRNPQLQCPAASIKYVDEAHVDPARDRMPGCVWLRRPARTTLHTRSSGAI
jgi:hypothetical protein